MNNQRISDVFLAGWAVVVIAVGGAMGLSCAGESMVASGEAGGGGADAKSCAVVDAKVLAVLEAMEKKGAVLKSFEAEMVVRLEQLLEDDVRLHNGYLYYQATADTVRFRISFADLKQWYLDEAEPKKAVKYEEDWMFDGRWLTRRNGRLKIIHRWEVARQERSRESFRLGRGPFPLPFALKKNDVLKEFAVKLIPADANDPEETVHLQLRPKKESDLAEQYVQWDLWVGPEDAVPRQIRIESTNYEIKTVGWSKIKLDEPIRAGKFKLKPGGKGWTTEVHPLEEGKGNL